MPDTFGLGEEPKYDGNPIYDGKALLAYARSGDVRVWGVDRTWGADGKVILAGRLWIEGPVYPDGDCHVLVDDVEQHEDTLPLLERIALCINACRDLDDDELRRMIAARARIIPPVERGNQ